MALYGVYGNHTTESCPLNNQGVRKGLIENGPKIKGLAEKNNVKIIAQYHSALEHDFLWVLDAENAHTVEDVMIKSGASKFNSLKIVPLTVFDDVIAHCKKIEEN